MVAKVMVVGLLMFIKLGVPFRVLSGADERAERGEEARRSRLPDVGHVGQGEVVKRAGGCPQPPGCPNDIRDVRYEGRTVNTSVVVSECSESSLFWFTECSDYGRSWGVAIVFPLGVL